MSPRLSRTRNVSPYLSARGGRLVGCVAVMAKEASEEVSVRPNCAAGLTILPGLVLSGPVLLGAAFAAVFGDIAFQPVRMRMSRHSSPWYEVAAHLRMSASFVLHGYVEAACS